MLDLVTALVGGDNHPIEKQYEDSERLLHQHFPVNASSITYKIHIYDYIMKRSKMCVGKKIKNKNSE